jgi:hypothetical protein
MAAHDTNRGDCYLQPRQLGIGLGSALLAELALGNWIWIQDELLYLNPDGDNYTLDDPAIGPLLKELRAETQKDSARRLTNEPVGLQLKIWIQQLQAGIAQEWVQDRLLGERTIQEEVRGLIRKRSVWVPIDNNVAGWPANRLKDSLHKGKPLNEQDLALAALVMAIGLSKAILTDLEPQHQRYLAQQLDATMRPALHKLVVVVEREVGRQTMLR